MRLSWLVFVLGVASGLESAQLSDILSDSIQLGDELEPIVGEFFDD